MPSKPIKAPVSRPAESELILEFHGHPTEDPPPQPQPLFLGVDPGASGAFAAVDPDGSIVSTMKLTNTWRDVSDWIESWPLVLFAVMEKVGPMPKQGIASTFKFGRSSGMCEAMLVAHKIPYDLVAPGTWQRQMKCLTKGDKNVSKAAAQRLWPSKKITHAIADACLLAELCRRSSPHRSV